MPPEKYRIKLGDEIYAHDLPYSAAIGILIKLLHEGKSVTIEGYYP